MVYKATLKRGGFSGRFPRTRKILKHLTDKQKPFYTEEQARVEAKIQETSNFPKGFDPSLGLPKNVKSFEDISKDPVFINVDDYIQKTVPEPKHKKQAKTFADELRLKSLELKRQYLKESVLKEEQSLINKHLRLKKIEESIQLKDTEQKKKLLETISVDNTIAVPTIKNFFQNLGPKYAPLIKKDSSSKIQYDVEQVPMINKRTPEEEELLALKREYNDNQRVIAKKIKNFNILFDLVSSSSKFITNEKQLAKRLEEVFENPTVPNPNIDSFGDAVTTNLSANFSKYENNKLMNKIDHEVFDFSGPDDKVKFGKILEYLEEEKQKQQQQQKE
ncbi:hypothetical protein ACO0SA_004476 [Hanseniaspora valbyensis]